MTALLLTVLGASLAGSLHCTGMCGAFIMLSCAPEPGSTRPTPIWLLQTAYHGGRLITYTVFGVVAGLLGASLDLGGSLIGLQQTALALAAATLIVFGLHALFRALGVRTGRPWAPAWLARLANRGHRFAWTLQPPTRALTIGLLTTLLPCGWLYAFVVTAAGTASPLSGALVMLAFWLGTLPALSVVGAGARVLAGPLAARLPVITAVALIAVGAFTLVSRAGLVGLRLPPASSPHGALAVPNPTDVPPCCRDTASP